MAKASIFNLSDEGKQLEALIESLEASETGLDKDSEAILYDALLQNEASISKKLEGAVMIIKEAEAEAEARKKAAADLTKAKKVKDNRALSVKNLIKFFLKMKGLRSHKAGIFEVYLHNNSEPAPLVITRKEIDEGDQEALKGIPEVYLQTKLVLEFDPNDQEALKRLPADLVRTELVLDLAAVRSALEAQASAPEGEALQDVPAVDFAIIGERECHVRTK